MLALVVVAQLLHPTEVLEHWTLLHVAPLHEEVSARGRYTVGPTAPPAGVRLRLPDAVQGGARPTAVGLGTETPLPVSAGPEGWEALWRAPPAPGALRVEATVRRPASLTRGRPFSLAWPRLVTATVPTRRVAWVRRTWLEATPQGWTCPDEPTTDVPCVTRDRAPGPVLTRVEAVPSPRGSAALGGLLGALVCLWVLRPSASRAERALAALGGATVGAATSLAVVGAGLVGWALALGLALPAGALVGVAALRSTGGRNVGVVALVLVPLLAVLGFGPRGAGGVAVVAAVAIVALAARGPTRTATD